MRLQRRRKKVRPGKMFKTHKDARFEREQGKEGGVPLYFAKKRLEKPTKRIKSSGGNKEKGRKELCGLLRFAGVTSIGTLNHQKKKKLLFWTWGRSSLALIRIGSKGRSGKKGKGRRKKRQLLGTRSIWGWVGEKGCPLLASPSRV